MTKFHNGGTFSVMIMMGNHHLSGPGAKRGSRREIN